MKTRILESRARRRWSLFLPLLLAGAWLASFWGDRAPNVSDAGQEREPVASLPTDGVCPKCDGPVAVVAPDDGVCTRCGEKLETLESRARRRWILVLLLTLAAAWIAALILLPPAAASLVFKMLLAAGAIVSLFVAKPRGSDAPRD